MINRIFNAMVKKMFVLLMLSAVISFSAAASDYTIITCDRATVAAGIMSDGLERVLGQVTGKVLHYNDPDAEAYIDALGIEFLPYVIFNDDIVQHEKFFELARSGMIDRKNGFYIVPEEMIAPAGKVLFKRESAPKRLDVYLTSQCTRGKTALRQLEDYMALHPDFFNVTVHFISDFRDFGIDSQNGPEEIREDIRQLIVQKYYPESYRSYLARYRAGEAFETSFPALGIDLEKVQSLQDEGVSMLREDYRLCTELGITYSPTFIIENQLLLTGTDAFRSYLKEIEENDSRLKDQKRLSLSSSSDHVAVFYSNECPHCRWLVDEHIPFLKSEFKERVVFDLYDISISENREFQLKMQQAHGVVGDSIPQVFVGDADFEGRDEIDGGLEEYLLAIHGEQS